MRYSDLDTDAAVCRLVGVPAVAPGADLKLGLSRSARTERPVHGLRRSADSLSVSGWYVWSGEMSEDADFFEPVHHAHLSEVCPLVAPFMSLPPGWRFLTDGEHVDVWFDAELFVKDPPIHRFLERLEASIGRDRYWIADYWEGDLVAIGVASAQTPGRLVYVCTLDRPDGHCFAALEFPPGVDSPDGIYDDGPQYDSISFEALMPIIAEHFESA